MGTVTYSLNGERMYPTHNPNLTTTTLFQLPTVTTKWQVTPISAACVPEGSLLPGTI